MSDFNRLVAVILSAMLVVPSMPLEARTRKGDKYIYQGRAFEDRHEWDAALEQYEKALSEDPADMLYQMAAQKARFQAAQKHVDEGLRIRALGQLGEALIEFQKAYQINPGSSVAEQEVVRTQQMIERERKRVEQTGKESTPVERGLTPAEEMKKQSEEKIKRMLPVPELKPLNPTPINLKINGQPVKVLFETVGKTAGLNVLWDPDYQAPARNSLNVEIENSTAEEALDYLAVITKSYWKPLSPNTIFITNDNPNKRRDFAEMVAKTFYLTNLGQAQELQEVMNVIRTVAEVTRVVVYNSQSAIIVRGEADQVALAEKLIRDLDKPRAEVVVDVMVIEVNSTLSRQLTAAVASTGLNVPVNFTPRNAIKVQTPSGTDSSGNPTTPSSTTGGNAIPLSQLGHLASSDFSITLPNALLQAVLNDSKSKVLQAPQLRSVDNVKATLKIGERQPTATGSFQPGIGGVGINPLVNTQFNYLDVGVNVEMTPRVHENGEVSVHISLDISSVTNYVDLGGIKQPVIGQRKVEHDIRMHEGEVNLLGGLTKQTENRSITGIPGLSSIPLLGRLFSGESTEKDRGELMIALIPHIVRRPDYTTENLRGIAAGNQTSIRLNYAPPPPETPARAANPAPAGTQPAVPGVATTAPGTAAPAMTPPATAPPATAPPATAPPATAPPATAPPATAPGAAPGAAPAGAPTAGNVRIQLSPAQIETGVSNAFTVAVMVSGATDVASAPMQIQFDPKMLRLNDVTRGDFLSSDSQPPVFTKNIMNDSGAAAIQLNRLPGSAGASGSGVIAVLNFQAVGKGATTVRIPNLTLRNSQGQVVASASPQVTVSVK